MAVKRVVMQHFSMNLALESRLRSLDNEDSGLGVEMETDSSAPVSSVEDFDDAIQFDHLSLDSAPPTTSSQGGLIHLNLSKILHYSLEFLGGFFKNLLIFLKNH